MGIKGLELERDIDMIILGFDGVLVDNFKRWKLFIEDLFLSQEDYEPPEHYFSGWGIKRMAKCLINEYFIPYTEEEIEESFKINVSMSCKGIPIIPDSAVFIEKLFIRCIPMSIVTDRDIEYIDNVFNNEFNKKFNRWQYKYFNIIESDTETDNKKIYKEISDIMNMELHRVLVVDDRIESLMEAHLNGLKVCAIKSERSTYTNEELQEINCTEIQSLLELL